MPPLLGLFRKEPAASRAAFPAVPADYWAVEAERLAAALGTTRDGLTQAEAERRLKTCGPNALLKQRRNSALRLLLSQFKSPLVLILVVAAVISAVLAEWSDALIVLAVVAGSTLLGFAQEYSAGNAVARLQSQVTIKSLVLRDGRRQMLPSAELVPGDVVLLSAGSLIPADGVLLVAADFFVNQAVLTGESFPVEKSPSVSPAAASLAERTNCVFMGTNVRSGTALELIVQTGKEAAFGQIAERLNLRPPQTEFERGIERFGHLLTQVMLAMVTVVFAANILMAKPAVDSLLFALALAVGLTPELLPAIISVALSRGARRMAANGVIVRRLNAIENLGSMDVLCTDKTGTLTAGVVRLDGAVDALGRPSAAVMRWAFLNSQFQTGLNNPLDEAIATAGRQAGVEIGDDRKIDEIPYDFLRKRLTVVSANGLGKRVLITKGALDNVLGACSHVQSGEEAVPLDDARRAEIQARCAQWGREGFRALGLATKEAPASQERFTRGDESSLVFAGFLLFFDPPKEDAKQVIANLTRLGVQLKIITGDNRYVARHVAEGVNLPVAGLMTGRELNDLHDEALWHAAERTTVFAEVDPNQKERIILALQKMGHVVGYMGDGINDAPALHAADVGLSVDTAVDVAKEAADFVLLKKDLDVLRVGIDEGRRTFANTLKYVLTTVSANFGNMFSMAAASAFLPYLPLLASQILLNNFLSDIPGAAIAGDNVDPEWVEKPRRWDTAFIRNYMVAFGLVSSIFDFLTFGALLYWFRASPEEFRTGWFIESVLTELVVALVVRTRHPFFRSRPSFALLATTLAVFAATLVLPYVPFAARLGFVPLPAPLVLTLLTLTALYVLTTEIVKRRINAWMERA